MDERENDDLSEALSQLKQQGSTLLVAGAVSDEKHGTISRQLLGDPAAGSRRRILILTEDHLVDVSDRFQNGQVTGPGEPRIIRVTESGRSAATETTGLTHPPAEHVAPESLGELATTIYETMNEINANVDLEPAELRLCFDSLTPLIQQHGEEPIFKMLYALNHALRRKNAMAHFHLPLDPDSETVNLLSPLFDALIELRVTNVHVQQRWHLHEANITTDWLDV